MPVLVSSDERVKYKLPVDKRQWSLYYLTLKEAGLSTPEEDAAYRNLKAEKNKSTDGAATSILKIGSRSFK